VRVRRSDAGDFSADSSALLRDYSGERLDIEYLRIEGTHEVEQDRYDAYFVLDGDGHVDLGDRILEIDEEDAVHINGQEHTVEGDLDVLAITARPDDD